MHVPALVIFHRKLSFVSVSYVGSRLTTGRSVAQHYRCSPKTSLLLEIISYYVPVGLAEIDTTSAGTYNAQNEVGVSFLLSDRAFGVLTKTEGPEEWGEGWWTSIGTEEHFRSFKYRDSAVISTTAAARSSSSGPSAPTNSPIWKVA